MSGTGVNPLFRNLDRFFLRSLARSVPICRNFQSNGVKWRSFEPWTKSFYIIWYYIKKFVQGLKLCHLTPFDWKFLRIGTLRAKDLRKNVLTLLKGGFTPAPLTLLGIRVVLLQKQAIEQRFSSLTVRFPEFLLYPASSSISKIKIHKTL